MRPDRALDEYAARQYGVFSLAQARRAGLTDRMVEHRTETGAWVRLTPGVYALASAPPRWERQMAAALLSRPGSIVGGASAAHLHRLEGYGPGRPVILAPLEANPRSELARVIRTRSFEDMGTVRIRGFPVSDLAETLVSIAGEAGEPRLERILDDALAAGALTLDQLMATIGRRRSRPGMRTLRRLAELRLPDAYQPPTTELERLLYRLLDHPGIPPVSRQEPLGIAAHPMTVDAFIPAWRLIVEADGRRWHTRKADFERDRARDNAATANGLAVLRFTYRMLVEDFAGCRHTVLRTGRLRATG